MRVYGEGWRGVLLPVRMRVYRGRPRWILSPVRKPERRMPSEEERGRGQIMKHIRLIAAGLVRTELDLRAVQALLEDEEFDGEYSRDEYKRDEAVRELENTRDGIRLVRESLEKKMKETDK